MRRNLVADGPPPCVVVRRYGGHLVCVEIDTATHRVGRTVRLLTMDAMPLEALRVEYFPLLPPLDVDTSIHTSVADPTRWY